MTQELHQAIASLLTATQKIDSVLNAFKAEAQTIQDKYDPVTLARRQFNNWRSSADGQEWKRQQFHSIGGTCSDCQIVFPTVGSFHIDHINPLSKYPQLATKLSNLQLLCSECNLRKHAS
jgi:5-methylcytosine-specific restriction endonuclease McrA